MKLITSVAGQTIKPALGFPTNSRVIAVELIPEQGKLSLISYVALFRGNAKMLYEAYQRFYHDATARWTGKIGVGVGRPAYAFAVGVWIGNFQGRIMFKLSDVITSEERRAYRISAREGTDGILHATLWCKDFESLLRKQAEFTIPLP